VATLKLTLRTVIADEPDNLATIAWEVFTADPQWDYRIPHRRKFPEDTVRCSKETYKLMLKKDGLVINVVTTEVEGEQRPIALAVWELMFKNTSNFIDIGAPCSLHSHNHSHHVYKPLKL